MKTTIIPALNISTREIPRFIDHISKRILLNKLSEISYGYLKIIDNNQIYEFGTADSHELKAVITVRNPGF